ncbi:hypothetical protein FQN57_006546 [Myotisia sp. PD_48]|nr:hypothetical protein FQN57_006546 [Myotisia sp. PD_48]
MLPKDSPNLDAALHANQLPPQQTYPVYYFFYGTLTNPEILQQVASLPEEPKLRKAEIEGYDLAKWGDYLALINGMQGQGRIISGYAYFVQSERVAQKLAYYETTAYKAVACQIHFKDDEEGPSAISGKTFMYAGDAQALLEQRFDRKLWELQMATTSWTGYNN